MLNERSKKPSIKNKPTLYFVLVVLVFFSQLYLEINTGGSGLFMPYNIVIWLAVTWFIAFGIFSLYFATRIILPKLGYTLLLSAGLIGPLISGVITGIEMPIEWWFRILFIVGGLLFLLILFQARFSNKQIDFILVSVVVLAVVNCLLSISQIHLAESLPFLFVSLHPLFPTGFLQQLNTNASFLSTSVIICFYLASRPLLRNRTNKYLLVLMVLNVALSAYIVFYSASRVGTLSIIVGVSLILISRWRVFVKNKPPCAALILALVFGIGAAMSSDSSTQLATKANSTFQHANVRIGIYETSLELIRKEPILGYGIGSFSSQFVEQAGTYIQKHPETGLADMPALSHPHNEFLFWFIEGGIIAVLGIFAFCTAILTALVSIGFQRGGAYAALLFPIVLHTQVELPFYLSSLHWFLFLFICYVVLNHTKVSYAFLPSQVLRKTLALTSVLILCLGSLFLFNTLKANQGITQYWQQMNGQLSLLTEASQNLYFSRYAERNIMAVNGVDSLENNDVERVKLFINWAESYLELYPDYVIRTILIKAYKHLGDGDKTCSIMKKSLFLYPKNQDLLALNKSLNCL